MTRHQWLHMSESINIDLISQLSKLSPTEEEQETLKKNLSSILEYVGTLQKVATSSFTHNHRQALTSATLREDVVHEMDAQTRLRIIANFPVHKGDLLQSPEVFE